MKTTVFLPEEKFFRDFDRKTEPLTPFSRLTVGREAFLGRRREGRFQLTYRRKGLFPLFSCTVFGRRTEKKGVWEISFGRPRAAAVIVGLWSITLMGAGLSVLFSEPFFASWFLLPGVLLSGSLFYCFPAEKKRLWAKLLELGAEEHLS